MDDKEFMEQTMEEVSLKELQKAISIKKKNKNFFKGNGYDFKVDNLGEIRVYYSFGGVFKLRFLNSLDALYKAVELSKKIRR